MQYEALVEENTQMKKALISSKAVIERKISKFSPCICRRTRNTDRTEWRAEDAARQAEARESGTPQQNQTASAWTQIDWAAVWQHD